MTVLPTYTQQHLLFSCRNCVKCASSLFIDQRLHKTTSCESFYFFLELGSVLHAFEQSTIPGPPKLLLFFSTVANGGPKHVLPHQYSSHPPELLHLYKSSLVPSHRCTTRP